MAAHSPSDPHAPAAPHHHVTPVRTYIIVWLILMFLTGVTVAASFVHVGHLNVPLALAIATVKATLVALIFMHLLYDEKFNLIVLMGGILFVIVFFAFTLIDPLTRGMINPDEKSFIVPEMHRTGLAFPLDAPTTATVHLPETGHGAAEVSGSSAGEQGSGH